MGQHSFPHDQWQIIRRVIHTTGDFDYAHWIRFSPDANFCGIEALRSSACIYADTRMIRAGLSPWRLEWHGNEVICPAESEQSRELAEKTGVTRTLAAFRDCSASLNGAVIAIGNAPTALLEVTRLIEEDGVRPALVIGVPVRIHIGRRVKERIVECCQSTLNHDSGKKRGRFGGCCHNPRASGTRCSREIKIAPNLIGRLISSFGLSLRKRFIMPRLLCQ